mmetsp:Transcript_13644/g.40001  ORF Transcript_13644/g.40001 Transcript_13644/m.40001 type:complete len:312 (+) Transcript_13644:1453-2388(+)
MHAAGRGALEPGGSAGGGGQSAEARDPGRSHSSSNTSSAEAAAKAARGSAGGGASSNPPSIMHAISGEAALAAGIAQLRITPRAAEPRRPPPPPSIIASSVPRPPLLTGLPQPGTAASLISLYRPTSCLTRPCSLACFASASSRSASVFARSAERASQRACAGWSGGHAISLSQNCSGSERRRRLECSLAMPASHAAAVARTSTCFGSQKVARSSRRVSSVCFTCSSRPSGPGLSNAAGGGGMASSMFARSPPRLTVSPNAVGASRAPSPSALTPLTRSEPSASVGTATCDSRKSGQVWKASSSKAATSSL